MITIITISGSALYENFVSPWLCHDLMTLGLSANINYRWSILGTEVKLETCLFDEDGYYKKSRLLLDETNKPKIIPAYSIKDVEKVLPYFLLTKSESGYEISLDEMYGVESKKALRLPDAMGALLLEAIKKRIVSLKNINAVFDKQAA